MHRTTRMLGGRAARTTTLPPQPPRARSNLAMLILIFRVLLLPTHTLGVKARSAARPAYPDTQNGNRDETHDTFPSQQQPGMGDSMASGALFDAVISRAFSLRRNFKRKRKKKSGRKKNTRPGCVLKHHISMCTRNQQFT